MAPVRDGIVTTVCPLDCPDTCSLRVEVTAGRIVAVDAAPGNPLTDGFICQKVKRHARRVYAPERVMTPLARTGRKGDGEFAPISWDDALDLFAARVRDAIDRYGPASIVPYVYNSSATALQSVLSDRLWRRLGASHVEHTICAATNSKAYREVFAGMLSADPHDVVHAKTVVMWGANPNVSNTHFPPLVTQAQRAGAQIAVVDPRRTPMAKRATLHLAPRPGTDVPLAYAIARWLAHNDGLDRAFLDQYASGVDEFLAAANAWTLPRASDVCGVDDASIVAFAELISTVRPTFFRVGWGLERNRNGGSACVAVYALPVLTGQFREPGAGVMSSLSSGAAPFFMGPKRTDDAPRPPRTPRARRPPRRTLNMNHIGRYLAGHELDPPLAVLFVQGSNPAATAPNQPLVHAGLARDDVFTVVHEQVMTDTARFADVVLPATTHFESSDVVASYGAYVLGDAPAVIDRVGESKTNGEVASLLAARLGLDTTDFDPAPEKIVASVLTEGTVLDGVRVVREPGTTVQFRDTFPAYPEHRARLAGLAEIDVPRYEPVDSSRYPLALLTPANPRTINTMFGEFNGPDPVLSLAPQDARERGIAHGDQVQVFNDAARITVTAHVDADLRAGVATIPKGLWCRATTEGLTANAFAPDTLSDLAGGATFNDARVEVQKLTNRS